MSKWTFQSCYKLTQRPVWRPQERSRRQWASRISVFSCVPAKNSPSLGQIFPDGVLCSVANAKYDAQRFQLFFRLFWQLPRTSITLQINTWASLSVLVSVGDAGDDAKSVFSLISLFAKSYLTPQPKPTKLSIPPAILISFTALNHLLKHLQTPKRRRISRIWHLFFALRSSKFPILPQLSLFLFFLDFLICFWIFWSI